MIGLREVVLIEELKRQGPIIIAIACLDRKTVKKYLASRLEAPAHTFTYGRLPPICSGTCQRQGLTCADVLNGWHGRPTLVGSCPACSLLVMAADKRHTTGNLPI